MQHACYMPTLLVLDYTTLITSGEDYKL